jgi:hypothetical protein
MKKLVKILAVMLSIMIVFTITAFAQEVTPDAKASFWSAIMAFLESNGWWVATLLLTISEGLGLSEKVKSNSIMQLLFGWLINWLKKKSVKPVK